MAAGERSLREAHNAGSFGIVLHGCISWIQIEIWQSRVISLPIDFEAVERRWPVWRLAAGITGDKCELISVQWQISPVTLRTDCDTGSGPTAGNRAGICRVDNRSRVSGN